MASTQNTKEASKAHTQISRIYLAHTRSQQKLTQTTDLPNLLRTRTTSLEGNKTKKLLRYNSDCSRGYLLPEEVAKAIKPWDVETIVLENLEKQAEPKKKNSLLLYLQNKPVAEGLHYFKSMLGGARDLDEDAFVKIVSQSYPWAAEESVISVSMTLNIESQQLSADDKVELKGKIRGILAKSASVNQAEVSVSLSPGSVKVDAEIRPSNAWRMLESRRGWVGKYILIPNNIAENVVEAASSIPGVKAAAMGEWEGTSLAATMGKLKVTNLEVKAAISEAKLVFDLMDSHASKELSIGEWAGAMAAFFEGTQDEKARALFDLLDEDCKGGLSKKELEERLLAPIKAMTPKEASPLVRTLARSYADQIMHENSKIMKRRDVIHKLRESSWFKQRNKPESVPQIVYEYMIASLPKTMEEKIELDKSKISCQECAFIRWDSLIAFVKKFVEEEVDKEYVHAHLAKTSHRRVRDLGNDWQSERRFKNYREESLTMSTDSAWHEVQKFKFLLDGIQHEVAVAHKEFVWHVSLDGKLMVDQKCHKLYPNADTAEFKVIAPTGKEVSARLEMNWVLKNMKWEYSLQVGEVNVPSSWNQVEGVIEKDDNCPKIFSESPSHQSLPQDVSSESEALLPHGKNCWIEL